ncbi:MAG TPA: YihY/virulence factor BrkB family protein [Anaerolineales bacterium]|nr:YihY/virulence factor BrkB family protein [Anaerolineales bacterium]
MRKLLSKIPDLFKLAYQGWKEDYASRLSAALAYYTIFSLAPLLVIVIAITGLIWEADVVRAQILSQIQALIGPEGADFVASLITSTGSPAQDIVALIIGIIILLFGALGVFNELHNSLNIIWNVKVEKPEGFLQAIKKVILDRLLSFTMILGIGFLLLVSLVITAGLSATQETIGNAFPFSEFILQIVNLAISIGVITVLFALMYKFLPDAVIAWRDVWLGAFVTAILFSIGKTAIGIYLGNSAVTSTFGAAGSLVLLLLWIYYSAQILFFGAEFTQVYANKYGSKILPEGKEKTMQPREKETKNMKVRPALVASSAVAISESESQLEKENHQTAQFFLGMMIASFLTGIFTAIFGLKKR